MSLPLLQSVTQMPYSSVQSSPENINKSLRILSFRNLERKMNGVGDRTVPRTSAIQMNPRQNGVPACCQRALKTFGAEPFCPSSAEVSVLPLLGTKQENRTGCNKRPSSRAARFSTRPFRGKLCGAGQPRALLRPAPLLPSTAGGQGCGRCPLSSLLSREPVLCS